MDSSAEANIGIRYFSKNTPVIPDDPFQKESFTHDEIMRAQEEAEASLHKRAEGLLAHKNLSHIKDEWDKQTDKRVYTELLSSQDIQVLKNLEDDNKDILSDYFAYLSSKRSLVSSGDRYRFWNIFSHAGKPKKMQEGVPVDVLLHALHRDVVEIENLPMPQSEKNSKIETILRIGRTLYKHSEPVSSRWRLTGGKTKLSKANADAWARIGYEQSMIDRDPLRDTGEGDKNQQRAIDTLNFRLWLKKPSNKIPTLTSPPITPIDTQQPTIQAEKPEQPPQTPVSPSVDEGPSPPPAPLLPEEEIQEIAETMVFTRRDIDAKQKAFEEARDMVNKEMQVGKRWSLKDWAHRTKFRLLQTYYIDKYARILETEKIKAGNAYLRMGIVKGAAVKAQEYLSEEKASAQAKIEQIHMGAKRRTEVIENLEDTELKTLLVDNIIKPIIEGKDSPWMGNPPRKITNETDLQVCLGAFVEANQTNPLIRRFFGSDSREGLGTARYFATDIWDATQRLKQHVETKKISLDTLDGHVNIKIANLAWGAQTRQHLSLIDRAVNMTQRNRLLQHVNPAVISAGLSLAEIPMRILTTKTATVGASLLTPGGGLIAGSAVSALRRFVEVKRDRTQMQTSSAYGIEPERSTKQTEALKRTVYDMARVEDLLNGGGIDLTTHAQRKSLKDLMDADLTQDEHRDALLRRIAEMDVRLDLSTRLKKDFVSSRGKYSREQDIWEIMKAKLHAEKKLLSVFSSKEKQDEYTKAFSPVLKKMWNEWTHVLKKDVTKKDKAFARYQWSQSGKAGILGGAIGLSAGVISHDVVVMGARAVEHLSADISPTLSAAAGSVSGQTFIETFGESTQKGVGHAIDKIREELGITPLPVSPDAPLPIDFSQLYASGGSETINDAFQVHVSGLTHDVHIYDVHANNLIPDTTQIVIDPSGYLHVSGELPHDVQTMLADAGFTVRMDHNVIADLLGESPRLYADTTIPGLTTNIPLGTHWEQVGKDTFNLALDGRYPPVVLIQHAHVVDGHLQWDTRPSVSPWTDHLTQESSSLTDGGARDALWKEKGVHIRHESYGYDQSGQQGNERLFFNTKHGERGVDLYMNRPGDSIQSNLNPDRIDVPQQIRDGNLVYAFEIPGMQESLIVQAGTDGHLILDPDDLDPTHVVTFSDGSTMQSGSFARMILNPEVYQDIPDGKGLATQMRALQDPKWFEWARLGGAHGEKGRIIAGIDWTYPDGTKVLKGIATIQANGQTDMARDFVVTVSPGETPPSYTIFPPHDGTDNVPLVPVVAYPRFPLPGEKKEGRSSSLSPQPVPERVDINPRPVTPNPLINKKEPQQISPPEPKNEKQEPPVQVYQYAAEIVNPNHPEACEDAHAHVQIDKNGNAIDRWIVLDGSGGSLPQAEADRSQKIRASMLQMSDAVKDISLSTPLDVLKKADQIGRSLPGYGTGLVVDFDAKTGDVSLAHSGDVAALKWQSPFRQSYPTKRLYDGSSGPSNIQLLTEQKNYAEKLRQGGLLKTVDLEKHIASARVTHTVGHAGTSTEAFEQGIVQTNTRIDDEEYLIVVTDGARVGDMLVNGGPLQKDLNTIMGDLQSGNVTIEQASKAVAEAAKTQAEREGGDYDDVTVVILRKEVSTSKSTEEPMNPSAQVSPIGIELSQ